MTLQRCRGFGVAASTIVQKRRNIVQEGNFQKGEGIKYKGEEGFKSPLLP